MIFMMKPSITSCPDIFQQMIRHSLTCLGWVDSDVMSDPKESLVVLTITADQIEREVHWIKILD